MTFDIDEATDFCKHKSSNYKRMSVDAGTMDLNPERARFEEECKRYEQLAEWLTELKARREADMWIPVSERLPEERGEYLCTLHYAVPPYHMFHPENNVYVDAISVQGFDGHTFISAVIAWKPLPEPYKENDNA